MKYSQKFLSAAAILSLTVTPVSQALAVESNATAPTTEQAKAPPAKDPSGPSLYLQCDGNPNNMAAGESLARFLGAVTLLGIFAPRAESPDASKRLFGWDGVSACSQLLNGEKAEGNVLRRLPLLLARAIHNIEAKDYAAAVQDVTLARQEASAANLTSNPYFARSMGLSFSLLEYEALIRKGDLAAARELNARTISQYKYSFYPMLAARERTAFYKDVSQAELDRLDRMGNFEITYVLSQVSLLSEAQRFPEAASEMEAILSHFDSMVVEVQGSMIPLLTAVAEGIAGNWQKADALQQRARANYDSRLAEGKPENNASTLIELFDFYKITKLAADGDLKQARRLFASRSEWSAPLFGQVLELNRRLRKDATPDELFGSLEKSADQLWTTRADNLKAAMLETDKNNKTLFGFILPYASMAAYERLSKRVWATEKSRLLSKDLLKTSKSHSVSIFDADAMTQPDALVLHAALQAKARGKSGFTFWMGSTPTIGFVRFGNRGDEGIIDSRYMDADAVIAELRQVIPTPEEIAARAKVKK